MNGHYVCMDCCYTFRYPIHAAEDDGLDSPPYRYSYLCPNCYSDDIEFEEDYDEFVDDDT
jgi:hypothetical protein